VSVITDKDFFNQIKNGTYGNLYLVYGQENYQKSLYMKRFQKRVIGENETFNHSVIPGAEFSVKRLSDEIDMLPVFAEKRFVEIIDPVASKLNDKSLEELSGILSDIPETAVVVFYYQTENLSVKEKASDKKLYTLLSKIGTVVDFSLKDENWLIKYVVSELQKASVDCDYKAAEYVVKNSNGEIGFINNEIEKIRHFSSGSFSEADAKEICAKSTSASRYDLASYIVMKNRRLVMEEIDRLIFMKVKPTVILSAIYSAFYDIYLVLCASVSKKNNADILSDFKGYKNREFVLNKARKNSASYDKKSVEKILMMIIEAESALKGSRVKPKLILEELSVKIMGTIR
jgi:DNA polymerase-3 subunit delta